MNDLYLYVNLIGTNEQKEISGGIRLNYIPIPKIDPLPPDVFTGPDFEIKTV